MRKLAFALLITIPAAWMAPAHAQLFARKAKVSVQQRLPELLYQAKSDPDERKRSAAAGELASADGKAHPEVVAILADIARSDPKPGVRHEAIQSLAQLRPVSQTAGQTLEWSAAHDDTWKNRLQAKSLLMRYQLSGYQASKSDAKADSKNVPPPMTPEPPVAEPRDPKNSRSTFNFPSFGRQMPSKPASNANAPKNNPPPVVVDQNTPPPVIFNQTAPPPVIVTQPAPPPIAKSAPPVIVTQPAPPVTQSAPPTIVIEPLPLPKVNATPTGAPKIVVDPAPPQIVIEPPSVNVTPPSVPKLVIEPLPKATTPTPPPPLILDIPSLDNNAAPKLTPPPVKGVINHPASKSPSAATTPSVTEPNFRPAGQTPPRTTTSPSVPSIPPLPSAPPAKGDSGPSLSPPM